MLSSILQECQVRSVESRANYFNVHSIFLGSCLAFESGNDQFVFLSSFLLMCVIQLTLKLTNRQRYKFQEKSNQSIYGRRLK